MNWRCVRSDYVTPADVVMQWQQPLERWSSNNVVKKWAISVWNVVPKSDGSGKSDLTTFYSLILREKRSIIAIF